jgi:hypothetical protein
VNKFEKAMRAAGIKFFTVCFTNLGKLNLPLVVQFLAQVPRRIKTDKKKPTKFKMNAQKP